MALARTARTEPQAKTDLISQLTGTAAHPVHTIDLAIWLGILTIDLELSDYGVALRQLAAGRADPDDSTGLSNGVGEFLLWLLLRQDTLLLAILQEWFEQLPAANLRVDSAIARLSAAAEEAADPDQLVPAMRLFDFRLELESRPDRFTEVLAARLEILAELGMVHGSDGVSTPPNIDPRLKSLITALRGRSLTRDGARSFLDENFFSSLAAAARDEAEEIDSADRALLKMVQAYVAIRRPLGFTPGRPIALLACCTALLEGWTMEIGDAYDCVYEAAESLWSKYLHFSGGSRFDREFLIRIDPELEKHLRLDLKH